ncbi:hypothetical protein PMIN02_001401 [Paraphaeosphaeria minitans]
MYVVQPHPSQYRLGKISAIPWHHSYSRYTESYPARYNGEEPLHKVGIQRAENSPWSNSQKANNENPGDDDNHAVSWIQFCIRAKLSQGKTFAACCLRRIGT